MKSILITGCNRGLGLGLVKHLVNQPQPPQNIFATCRDVNNARTVNTTDPLHLHDFLRLKDKSELMPTSFIHRHLLHGCYKPQALSLIYSDSCSTCYSITQVNDDVQVIADFVIEWTLQTGLLALYHSDLGNLTDELTALAEISKNIHIIEIDLTDTKSYDKIVETVTRKVGSDGLNVLFNNAGISTKFTRLGLVKEKQLTETFFINTAVPILLTKALFRLLKIAANKYEDKTKMSVNKCAIINMSSILGSIAENTTGGFYPYRCSKAALNAATKSMSVDFKEDGILVTCLHPGWVRTDMGGNNAPTDIDTSVTNILNTLSTLNEKHTGCFIQHDGQILPW